MKDECGGMKNEKVAMLRKVLLLALGVALWNN